MRKLISFIFLCSFTGLIFAEKKADVFVRELKLRFLDSETGVPVKGLKVYNIITTEKLVYSYFFGIPSLCIGGKSYDLNHFVEQYETDSNGEVVIKERHIFVKKSRSLESQTIVVNTECLDKKLSDYDKGNYLKWIRWDKPDVKGYTFTPNKKYKNVSLYFKINSNGENETLDYLQTFYFCYDLPFQTKNGYYIKYKSFEHSPETIEIKIQQR